MNSKKVNEFNKLLTNQKVLEYLKSVAFNKPTSIQSECILPLAEKKNAIVFGKTGSGKTLGYLLPLIQNLKDAEDEKSNEQVLAAPKAVIVLPTRELALQVFAITKSISHFAKLRVRKLVGGDKGKSLTSLFASEIDILITTPDRCLRCFENQELLADHLRYLVLDEADQLLEPSFKATMEKLIQALRGQKPQVALISASRPVDFEAIVQSYFPETKFVNLGSGEENVLNHQVKTFNIAVEENLKFSYAQSFIKEQGKRNGIIFVGNKSRAKKLYAEIQKTGMKKLFIIHKELEIRERIQVVQNFRAKGGIMIATDVFARGIDIGHLEWVLNFDLPSAPDYYLHRSGRVGRAGRSGRVFNFVTSKDDFRQKMINESLLNQGRKDLKITHKAKSKVSSKSKPIKRRRI